MGEKYRFFSYFLFYSAQNTLFRLHYLQKLYFSPLVLRNSGTRRMSTQLATIDLTQLPSTQIGGDEVYQDLAKDAGYLKYIKLCSGDKYVKRKMIEDGHFGIPRTKDEVVDLGEAVDVIPLARRPKAVDLSDLSAIVTSYDSNSEVFKDIRVRASGSDSGCQWGTSFLMLERSTGLFYEFFFGTNTSRPEAANVFNAMNLTQDDIDRRAAAGADVSDLAPHGPLPVTLKADFRQNKKGMWYTPVVLKCSTPFSRVPPIADIVAEIGRFTTIKSEGTEKVKDERKGRAR